MRPADPVSRRPSCAGRPWRLRTPVRQVACAAALWAGLSAVAAADALVIASDAEGLAPGAMIADGATLSVPAGATVTLMTSDGAMSVIEGPFSGPPPGPAGAGILGGVAAVVDRQGMTRRLGAVRGDVATGGDGLAVDLLADEPFCIAGGRNPDLALPARQRDRVLTLTPRGGGAAVETVWPAGAERIPWPAGATAAPGRSYDAAVDGLPVGAVTLTAAATSANATPGARALAYDAAGCARQAEAALLGG